MPAQPPEAWLLTDEELDCCACGCASRASEHRDHSVQPAVTPVPTNLDRLPHAGQARVPAGLSATSLTLPLLDWAVHLAGPPGQQRRLADVAIRSGRTAATGPPGGSACVSASKRCGRAGRE